VLTGTARAAQEAKDREEALMLEQEIERKKREVERRRRMIEGQIATLRARLESEEEEIAKTIAEHELKKDLAKRKRREMARLRMAEKRNA
jgi:circadian clock protein KaiC